MEGTIIIPNEFYYVTNIGGVKGNVVYYAKRKGVSDGIVVSWTGDDGKIISEVIYYKAMFNKLNSGDFMMVDKDELKPTYEELLKALKYAHRFASRNDSYDINYVQNIIDQTK